MSEISEVLSRLSALEREQARMETVVDHQLATREWVRELMGPVTDAVRKIEHALETQAADNKMLKEAHNNLLEERSRREQEKHEAELKALQDKTLMAILQQRWAPVGAFVLTTAGILALIGKGLELFLANR